MGNNLNMIFTEGTRDFSNDSCDFIRIEEKNSKALKIRIIV